jgi:hypothetical protein
MYDWTTLKHSIKTEDIGYLCPVGGCTTRLHERQKKSYQKSDRFSCKIHDLIFSPTAFEYIHPEQNILWDYDCLLQHTTKREKGRLGRDNSEDAVTWNLFRYLDSRGQLLLPFLTNLSAPTNLPLQTAQTIFWAHDRITGKTWDWLMRARTEFELRPSHGSEPDLIIFTDRVLFFIEAKVNASNNTVPRNHKCRDKYVNGSDCWWNTAFNKDADYDQIAVNQKKYELMRFWLLGTWIAKELNLDFRLISLLRDKDTAGKDIESTFKAFLPEARKNDFKRVTWESIYQYIANFAPDHPDKNTILKYLQNKTIGYQSGKLRKAFNIG